MYLSLYLYLVLLVHTQRYTVCIVITNVCLDVKIIKREIKTKYTYITIWQECVGSILYGTLK
jgi:hypothetical protein